ncbi:winged helix-turn-helix domain-containing protein [Woodsholea maritima]|uniref:winged helix-turn-helix domain-containing protein n=1 Tax=Woodsholea maritima TaxID=240237 RepID=UPI0003810D64|nr:transcriptional regulator [Woodsholea maritima]
MSGISKIDDVIHGRIWLGVVTYLANVEAADFTELKTVLETTQGNLSVHLRKLEDAGYIAIEKQFKARKPLTLVRLTQTGRAALAEYITALDALLGGVKPQP